MNERIKEELVEQAITQNESGWPDFRKALTGSGSLYLHVFAEEFAELIVKECADKILFEKARTPGQSDYMRGYRDMADNAVFVIKKHFGVKE